MITVSPPSCAIIQLPTIGSKVAGGLPACSRLRSTFRSAARAVATETMAADDVTRVTRVARVNRFTVVAFRAMEVRVRGAFMAAVTVSGTAGLLPGAVTTQGRGPSNRPRP